MDQADKEAFERWLDEDWSGLSQEDEKMLEKACEFGLSHARSGEAVAVTTVAQIEEMKNGYSRNITARDPSFVQFPDDNDVKLFTHSQPAEHPLEAALSDAMTHGVSMVRISQAEFLKDHIEQPREVVRLTDQDVNDAHASAGVFPTESSERLTKAILDALIKKNGSAPSLAVAQGDVNKELLEALQNLVDRDFTFFNNKMVGCSKSIMRADVLKAREAINKAERYPATNKKYTVDSQHDTPEQVRAHAEHLADNFPELPDVSQGDALSNCTQGNWQLVDGRHEGFNRIFINSPSGVICRISNKVSGRQLTDEDLANAHLLSASKELLEALKGMLSDFVESDPLVYHENWESVIKAKAAINKAEGQS